jgi:DNA mismatch endonuclease Vsr
VHETHVQTRGSYSAIRTTALDVTIALASQPDARPFAACSIVSTRVGIFPPRHDDRPRYNNLGIVSLRSIVPLVVRQKESWASSDRVRSVMRGNRARDTRPELAIRSAVHRLGLRYRVCIRPVQGVRRSADVVFPGAHVAVFVDGCFWHGCPEHYVPSLSNRDYWDQKIAGNRARDEDTNQRLADEGWVPLRIWAHEDPQTAALLIAETVRRNTTERRRLHGRRDPSAQP